jgi:iron complex outermembrane receptor protein
VRSGDSAVGVSVRRDALTNDYPYLDDNGTRFKASDDVSRSRANADAESYDGWGLARISLGPQARLIALANLFTREQGVTGLSVIPATAARLRSRRALGAVSASVPCSSETNPNCSLELTTTGLSTSGMLTDSLRELALGSTSIDSRGQRLSQQERLHYDLGTTASFTLASSQEGERLDVDTAEGSALRAGRGVVRGAGTLLVRPSSVVTVQALGSLECNSTSGPGRDARCDALPTGRLGLAVTLTPEWKVSANTGRYVRVPTLGELYGISATLRPNPSLDPETGWNGDAGASWSHRGESYRVYSELFAFARFASQLIAYRRSSFGAATPYNVGAARILGAEASAGADAFGALRAELSATALDPRDTTSGRTVKSDLLPLRSRLIVSPYVELYAEHLLGLDRAALGARVFHRSAEVADDAGLLIIEAQTSVDAELMLSLLQKRLNVRGRVADVFDAALFDIVGYPLPRRSVHASVEVEW